MRLLRRFAVPCAAAGGDVTRLKKEVLLLEFVLVLAAVLSPAAAPLAVCAVEEASTGGDKGGEGLMVLLLKKAVGEKDVAGCTRPSDAEPRPSDVEAGITVDGAVVVVAAAAERFAALAAEVVGVGPAPFSVEASADFDVGLGVSGGGGAPRELAAVVALVVGAVDDSEGVEDVGAGPRL